MKKCPNCSGQFQNYVKFCAVCGTPLQDEKNKKMIVIIIVAVVVVLGAFIGFFCWNHVRALNDEGTKETAKTQMTEAETKTTEPPVTAQNNGQTQAHADEGQASVPMDDYEPDDYILAGSDNRYISASEVSALSDRELRLARNEIYARKGRIFDDAELNAYFSSQSWYHGTIPAGSFTDDGLSKIEKANIETIKAEEAGR